VSWRLDERQIGPQLPGDLIAAVHARDTLAVTSAQVPGGIASLARPGRGHGMAQVPGPPAAHQIAPRRLSMFGELIMPGPVRDRDQIVRGQVARRLAEELIGQRDPLGIDRRTIDRKLIFGTPSADYVATVAGSTPSNAGRMLSGITPGELTEAQPAILAMVLGVPTDTVSSTNRATRAATRARSYAVPSPMLATTPFSCIDW
jgi:hypothetical protein